ncbi:hypothetical protein [Paraburkholderia terricola]|jgi:hypothetical protein|uniref:hypothetical protein n=1 Tax=Paraburkholderia terricola TaxID=169427 RepID=UPI003ECDCEAE
MNLYELHLCAKLFRISNPLRDFKPEFEKMRFVQSASRLESLAHKPIVLFSGAYIIGQGLVTLPFALAFSLRNGLAHSSLPQVAFCDPRIASKLQAFLSILDYLESIGELPPGSRLAHQEKLLYRNDGSKKRGIVEDYPAFCDRAAKDLPYDISLALLAA